MIYEQTPIRLQATLVGNPPLPPIDINTNQPPKFWRAAGAAVSIGIFDAYGTPVNLSNLGPNGQLLLSLFTAPGAIQPVFVKSILGSDLYPLITVQGWQNGTQQNCTFIIDPADIDVSLDALPSLNYWLQLSGITATGNPIIYAAGIVKVYLPGLYLPLPPYGYVSRNDQENDSGNTSFAMTSMDQTSILNVGGTARTSDVLLPIVGLTDGALQRLVLNLPTTLGITLQIKNNFVGGQILQTITTGGQTYIVLYFFFDADLQTWVLYDSTLNASTGSGAAGAPIDVPANTTFTVPANQQVLYSLPITVEGTIDVNGALIQV